MKRAIPTEDLIRLLVPSPVMIVAARSAERLNLCTVAWATALDYTPPKGILVLASGQVTAKAAVESGVLSINIPSDNLVDAVHGIGKTSSRLVDKLERFGLSTRKGATTGADLINETVAEIECRILDHETNLGRSMREAYDLIPVELLAGYADPDWFDRQWKLSNEKRLLHHLGSNSFVSTGTVTHAIKR